jgi:hypothetical protein
VAPDFLLSPDVVIISVEILQLIGISVAWADDHSGDQIAIVIGNGGDCSSRFLTNVIVFKLMKTINHWELPLVKPGSDKLTRDSF